MRLLIVLLVLLVGCSQAPAETELTGTDKVFISALHRAAPEFSNVEDAELVALGHQVCSLLDSGATVDRAVELGERAGLSMQSSGALVGISIGAYCPEHSP